MEVVQVISWNRMEVIRIVPTYGLYICVSGGRGRETREVYLGPSQTFMAENEVLDGFHPANIFGKYSIIGV